ncbi:hypothetical protein CsatB_022816 [Cannabis sativa]
MKTPTPTTLTHAQPTAPTKTPTPTMLEAPAPLSTAYDRSPSCPLHRVRPRAVQFHHRVGPEDRPVIPSSPPVHQNRNGEGNSTSNNSSVRPLHRSCHMVRR